MDIETSNKSISIETEDILNDYSNIKTSRFNKSVYIKEEKDKKKSNTYKENKVYKDEKYDTYKLDEIFKNEYAYPHQTDPEFQKKIYEKREFHYHRIPDREQIIDYNDIKEYRDNICGRKRAPYSQQMLLANFMSPNTPYSGLLVVHGTGTGKTCLAVNIIEQFKPSVQKYGTKIYILVSGPLIKEMWKNALIECTGETYLKNFDNMSHMTKGEYERQLAIAKNAALQNYVIMSYKGFMKKVLGEKILDKTLDENNNVVSKYRKNVSGEIERDIGSNKIYNLDNTIIVCDEAHNFTDNTYGDSLTQIKKNSTNLRLLLLSATPMKNIATDIVPLINFVRPYNNQMEKDKIFFTDDSGIINFKPGGIEYFKNMARGYVSYLRGADPLTFAKRVDMGEVPNQLQFTKLSLCEMNAFQREAYDIAVQSKSDTLDKKSSAVANFVLPGLSNNKKDLLGYYGREGITLVRQQLKTNGKLLNSKIGQLIIKLGNITNTLDKKIIEDTETFLELNDATKSITGDIFLLKYLKYFSIKFYKSFLNIEDLFLVSKLDNDKYKVNKVNNIRTGFIYSNLVKVGIEIFEQVLIKNGYLEYNENNIYDIKDNTKCYFCGISYSDHANFEIKYKINIKDFPVHEFAPATYITVTGKSSDDVSGVSNIPEEKKKLLSNVFSHIENKEGKFIKFVLGSRVMNEGISLHNVARILILDTCYNFGRVDQVVGRGIRSCSHYKIINDNYKFPSVEIYKFAVTINGNELSTEENLYRKSEIKHLFVAKIFRAMKEVAIDCPLHLNANIFKEELVEFKDCHNSKDNPCPALCDYTNCEYKCDDKILNEKYYDPTRNIYKKINKENLDYSTFTHSLAKNEIEYAKDKIKELYKLGYVYTLDQIEKYVHDSYDTDKQELFDKFFVFKALDDMLPATENDFNIFKDTIYDKYQKQGYLIYRDKFYIFQPFNQNEDVSMYYRMENNNIIDRKLTLSNYIKNTGEYTAILDKSDFTKSFADDMNNNNSNNNYDFDTNKEYYNSRKEFEIVGYIDKESVRKKPKHPDDILDVFKIRNKREKIMDKKRGTGIPTVKGAVCNTAKTKEYLVSIAEKLGIKLTKEEMSSRIDMCEEIKRKLLEKEKYNENNMTYIVVPNNHSKYPFPYNLKDRSKLIYDDIQNNIKLNIDATLNKYINKETKLPYYMITFKNANGIEKYANILKKYNAVKNNKGIYEIYIE